MTDKSLAHISQTTLIQPALQGWEMFLVDQGRSPHTVKAFLADLRLLASYLPPDCTRLFNEGENIRYPGDI